MKYIFKNLKSFIRTERMIFSLMLICVVVSSFVIDFSYGLYQNYHVVKKEETGDLSEFEINFHNTDSKYASKEVLKDTMLSFSDDLNNEISTYYIGVDVPELHDYGYCACRVSIKDGKFAANEVFKENLERQGLSDSYFSDEQEANGEHVALVMEDNQFIERFVSDDETIIFQGSEFKVIGYGGLCTVTVPFNSLKGDTVVNNITFVFDKFITRSQYDEIKEKMSNAFKDIADIPNLDIPESEQYYLYNTVIIISVMIALLSAINFAVLYRYILSKRLKSLAIFRICGCSVGKALGIFLSECMIITIPVFTATTILYDKFILPILSKHFEYIESAYSFNLYLMIFAIYILSSLIVLIIMIYFDFMTKSIKEIGQK